MKKVLLLFIPIIFFFSCEKESDISYANEEQENNDTNNE